MIISFMALDITTKAEVANVGRQRLHLKQYITENDYHMEMLIHFMNMGMFDRLTFYRFQKHDHVPCN